MLVVYVEYNAIQNKQCVVKVHVTHLDISVMKVFNAVIMEEYVTYQMEDQGLVTHKQIAVLMAFVLILHAIPQLQTH
jgi:hypothetical protein